MNTPLNLVIFLMFICFLILTLYFFFKTRKKDYRLKIQETRLDQINQEISKKQHEIDFARRKLEDQKIKLEQENSKIKSEREKLAEESHRISEDKVFLEQEKKKLQERIQNVKEKFQDVVNQIDRKNEEAENKVREAESEKENVELDKAKLEAAKKEITDASKGIQSEWQKIRLEKDRLEKRKAELTEKEYEIQNKEQHLLEERQSIDFEKEKIKCEWQKIKANNEEIEKQANRLNEREQENNEKLRQLEIEREFIENEKSQIENEWQQIKAERDRLEKQNTALKEQANNVEEKQKQLEDKEGYLNARSQELDEKERVLKKEKEEFEKNKLASTNKMIGEGAKGKTKIERPPRRPIAGRPPKSDGHERKTRIIPELICWEKGRCWHLGIQISKQLQEDYNVQILQDEESLNYDENDENCWVLKSISSVKLKWQEENKIKEWQFSLIEDEDCFPLLFRLIGKNEKHGKLVKNPSCGAYCAIVPNGWQRDEELSESAPFTPEHFFISGYEVHFFYFRRNSGFSIAFIKPNGKPAIRDPKGSRFSFYGNQIPDAYDEIGPLFGDELPKIIDSQAWNEISTIIIGEEGEGIGELRWEIHPDPNSHELDLNQLEKRGEICILKSKRGWFFIRFYDFNDKLVESLDFRYIQGLKKIMIPDHSFIPSLNGHQSVDIKFFHDRSCMIAVQKDENNRVIVQHYREETVATIPNDPAWDLSDWEIKDGTGRKVEIELLVERIWWNLWNEKEPLNQIDWRDKPINIPRDYCTPTSQYAISLQFPKTGWIKNIAVGFNKRKGRHFKVLATQRSIKIPLREFSDCEEISKPIDQIKLLLWIDENGSQNEIAIAKIELKRTPIPEPKPEQELIPIELNKKPCCSTCDHAIEKPRLNVVWCRRSNWPQQTDIRNFQENIAHFKCGEWRGEFKDKNGNWVSK